LIGKEPVESTAGEAAIGFIFFIGIIVPVCGRILGWW
jgi:hypothetical protein